MLGLLVVSVTVGIRQYTTHVNATLASRPSTLDGQHNNVFLMEIRRKPRMESELQGALLFWERADGGSERTTDPPHGMCDTCPYFLLSLLPLFP